MKAIILFVALFVGIQVSYSVMAQGDVSQKTTKTASDTKSGNVYVCSGKTSKAYHTNKNCAGLKKCKGEVKEYSEADAKAKGYTACKSCNKTPKVNN